MQIGSYLKEHRKSRHFTQEQVANELHISRQAISAWENNASFPDLENLVLLSQLYQTSVDSLIGNVTPENTLDIQEQTADLQEVLPLPSRLLQRQLPAKLLFPVQKMQ